MIFEKTVAGHNSLNKKNDFLTFEYSDCVSF